MSLIIDHYKIDSNLISILNKLREETNSKYFKYIQDKGDNILINCPHHKDGNEQHPSCYVYNKDDDKLQFGFCHCFTCNYKVSLPKLVADCFDEDYEFGKKWLIDNFGHTYVETEKYMPEINFKINNKIKEYLDESILKNYDYYHPYMWKRKLSKEVVDKFRVGYDMNRKAITFPVYDEHNKLVMITARSVENKKFYIDKGLEKPVYLLNEIIKNNIDTCYVCESQINALYMWTLGKPAVALIGTGTRHQYEVLNKSGVRRFILAFDGDEAGDKGIKRFIQNINEDKIIDVMFVSRNKDVNDLTQKEIESLQIVNSLELCKYCM